MSKRAELRLENGEEVRIITSDSKSYVFQNKDGNLIIVSWHEPLCDSTGRQFELRDRKIT